MFPAARIGDPITHDTKVPCGLIIPPPSGPPPKPVMIEYLPAAYVTCGVACTGVISGGIAHPPPPPTPPVPIIKGSATVMICGQPAARWTPAPDAGGCGVFLGNSAMASSRTVLIGDMGGAGGGGAGGGGAGEEGGGEGSDGGSDESTQDQPQDAPPGESTQSAGTGTHWVGIEMVDEAEQPVVGERFLVKLPEGKEVEGGLDRKGQARLTGIKDPGACSIKFPNLDMAAWERWQPASSQPPAAAGPAETAPPNAPAGAVPEGPPTRGGAWRKARQNDCIASIAKETGHYWETLWNDAANAELKRRRGDHNVLRPEDAVFVPDKRLKEESGNTDQNHKFRRKGQPEMLRIRVLHAGTARANEPYTLSVDGKQTTGTSDAEGRVQCPIAPNARRAILTIGKGDDQRAYAFALGRIDPISELSGVQGRLENMGYDCGGERGHLGPGTEQAVREFQAAHQLEATGRLDDATREKIKEEYGC